jgi:hypothetical protein
MERLAGDAEVAAEAGADQANNVARTNRNAAVTVRMRIFVTWKSQRSRVD